MTDQAKPASRPRRRFLRFSVRGMIMLVLVIGGWLGRTARVARIQREAVAAIRKADGEISYDWEWKSGAAHSGKRPQGTLPVGRSFRRRLLRSCRPRLLLRERDASTSEKGRTTARGAEESPHAANEEPSQPRDSLTGCTPEQVQIGHEPWEPNERDAVLPLLKGLSGLSRLDLNGVDLTGDRLLWLEGLTTLTHLDLGRTRITDSRLRRLRTLVKLSELNLDGTEITDAGLAHLKGLTRLSRIDLGDTRVTDAGVHELQQALPSLTIYR